MEFYNVFKDPVEMNSVFVTFEHFFFLILTVKHFSFLNLELLVINYFNFTFFLLEHTNVLSRSVLKK